MKKDALHTTSYLVTNVDTAFGSQIPINMLRYIYRVKWINLFDGANLLTLGKRENGAGPPTVVVDVFQAALQYDQDTDLEDLDENSAPLYVIGGTGATGASFLWAVATQNNMILVIWYEDAPAPS